MHAVSVGRGPLSLAVKATVKALTPTTAAPRRACTRLKRRIVFADAAAARRGADARAARAASSGEVVALSEYLGRDLVSLWGYDRVRLT